MKTKALYLTAVLGMILGFSSCDLNYAPSDELNSEILLQSSKGAETVMNGCYALLKDEVEFLGYSSGNTYIRHYTQMAEFPADNTCLSGHTTDPLYEAAAYMMNDGLKNVGTLWMVAYKVIYMCNTVIETLDANNPENNQLLGEAYFMRGLMHLHLVTLYAKPYSMGRNNLGVPLRVSTASEKTERNQVGDVYDQIAKDLRKAADLMGASRGNAGYPSHDAALGVLSRVYLYMEEYDKCIAAVNEALNGADPASKLDNNFATYFRNAKTSKETLFCVAHETTDDCGQSSIGSMYLKDGIGWGEIYPSLPLLNLYERYPEDLRYSAFLVPQYSGTGYQVYFPSPTNKDDASGRVNLSFNIFEKGDSYAFKDGKDTIDIEKRLVNGEYYEYFVNYKGVECAAYVTPKIKNRNTNPVIYINKFSYQDGNPMLSSPVVCRWAEVILNRAEAYARSGHDAEALADVNTIRNRAGIPAEGMFAPGNLHGYDNAIDVVMDERRLELAFEGFRMFDVYRNKMNMDRRFPGAQPWAVVSYDDPHIQYPIPNNEWTVSGIPQNPGY